MEGLARGRGIDAFRQISARPGNPARPAPGIDRIAHDRVSNMLEVDPDLMGSAGVEIGPDEVCHAEPGQDAEVGPG